MTAAKNAQRVLRVSTKAVRQQVSRLTATRGALIVQCVCCSAVPQQSQPLK